MEIASKQKIMEYRQEVMVAPSDQREELAAGGSQPQSRRLPLKTRQREHLKMAREQLRKKREELAAGGSQPQSRRLPLKTRQREHLKMAREQLRKKREGECSAAVDGNNGPAEAVTPADSALPREEVAEPVEVPRTNGAEVVELRLQNHRLMDLQTQLRRQTLIMRRRMAQLSAERSDAIEESLMMSGRVQALERELRDAREQRRETAHAHPHGGETFIIHPSQVLTSSEILNELYTFKTLLDALRLPEGGYATVEWLAQRGLLYNARRCEECMCSYHIIKREAVADGATWYCRNCRTSKSVRDGSFFSRSKLALWQVVLMIYGFAACLPEATIAAEIDVSCTNTIVDWCNFCREVCSEWVARNHQPIGGFTDYFDDVKDVEVDESFFFHRKYHRGRYSGGVWVVGGVERGSGKCFLRIVDSRNRETLEAIIKEEILPGSHVITDAWPAYNTIETLNSGVYTHDVVNHTTGFVNPEDAQVHTNTIEGLWQHAKAQLRRGHGTSPDLFPKYLDEFVWRRNAVGGSPFTRFLVAVRDQYCL